MNIETSSEKNRHQLVGIGLLAARCTVLVGIFAASSWAAAAGSAPVFNKDDSVDIAPWTPDIVTAIDEYVPAPSFNFGRFNLDHFAAANSLDQQGAVTAQLANGSIVVAGLVPDGVGGGFCGDGTKLCSIGLVNYNTIGQRLTWPSAGANGRFSNNYVVWPGAGSPYPGGFRYIRDVSVRGNLIDVLVDWIDSSRTGLGRADVAIATFRDTGEFEGWNLIFGDSASGTEFEDFYGAQMIQINSTTMIVAATTFNNARNHISVTRLVTDANQPPKKDATWGVPYNPAPNTFFSNRLVRYYPPNGLCDDPPCNATAGYVARQEGFATATDFYVSGSVGVSGNDLDVVTLKISSATGALKTEFNGGWVRTSFDQPESTFKDLAAGLYVYQDDVYIAAQVAQKCDDGIGMAKINGATGGFIPAFGGSGKVVFGGRGNAPICFTGNNNTVPFAITATGGRIGVAGYQATALIMGGTRVDPMLAVVNAVNGQVLDIDSHPVLRADGTRFGDAVLYGIYGGPSVTSPFTVSGNGRDTTAGNTLSYLTGRFIPVSSDRIFASGFD